VLPGALGGVLPIGIGWHTTNERAKRAPQTAAAPAASGRPISSDKGAAAPASSTPPVGIIAVPARIELLALDIGALGTAKASESIAVTAKVANIVNAAKSARASRHASATCWSNSTANRRAASARSRLSDTVIHAPLAGCVGLRRVSAGSLVNPGAVVTTLDDTSRIKVGITIRETSVAAIMLVGRAVKNGILIVESADPLRDRGVEYREAVIEAPATCLRPMLMTRFCTAFGALPLMLASGAGAGSLTVALPPVGTPSGWLVRLVGTRRRPACPNRAFR